MVQAQSEEISTKFMSGNVIFTWPSSGDSSSYDVTITRNTTKDQRKRITVPEYIVKNAILYHSIDITMYYLAPTVREIRSAYNGSLQDEAAHRMIAVCGFQS
uniref:Uncharacterized protein n=1 Tax=Magallana gigas TaxID=29159 RepID=K1PYB9_MAGGI